MAGSADLRAAFNSISAPRFICSLATLHYEQIGGQEWQIITFHGMSDKEEPFEVNSGAEIRAGDDLNTHAKRIAQRMLDQGKT